MEYFVFFDLETTGLPHLENNDTRITELAMVAVSRNSLLNCRKNEVPRILHKLVLCFNPQRPISSIASEVSGLWNNSLNGESTFDKNTTNLVNAFLEKLKAPICIIAHNGFKFDYPIFNAQVLKTNRNLIDGIVCIDSLPFFKNILRNEIRNFKLADVYLRLMGQAPENAHRAESDCMILLNCCVATAEKFVNWCDAEKVLLNSIQAM